MPPTMLPSNAFAPVSPLLRDKKFALVIAGTVGVQIALVSLSLPGWECPFFRVTGIPCPGCGLTRAVILLLKGDLQASLRFHAFAPIVLLSAVALVLVLLLPRSITQPAISKMEMLEQQTGLTVIILVGLILYWLARLLFLQTAFVQLIRG
jgi:Protein of unknown function (DUF2752).